MLASKASPIGKGWRSESEKKDQQGTFQEKGKNVDLWEKNGGAEISKRHGCKEMEVMLKIVKQQGSDLSIPLRISSVEGTEEKNGLQDDEPAKENCHHSPCHSKGADRVIITSKNLLLDIFG